MVDGTLMLKVVDCFNKKYINNVVLEDDPNRADQEPTTPEDFIRHKE